MKKTYFSNLNKVLSVALITSMLSSTVATTARADDSVICVPENESKLEDFSKTAIKVASKAIGSENFTILTGLTADQITGSEIVKEDPCEGIPQEYRKGASETAQLDKDGILAAILSEDAKDTASNLKTTARDTARSYAACTTDSVKGFLLDGVVGELSSLKDTAISAALFPLKLQKKALDSAIAVGKAIYNGNVVSEAREYYEEKKAALEKVANFLANLEDEFYEAARERFDRFECLNSVGQTAYFCRTIGYLATFVVGGAALKAATKGTKVGKILQALDEAQGAMFSKVLSPVTKVMKFATKVTGPMVKQLRNATGFVVDKSSGLSFIKKGKKLFAKISSKAVDGGDEFIEITDKDIVEVVEKKMDANVKRFNVAKENIPDKKPAPAKAAVDAKDPVEAKKAEIDSFDNEKTPTDRPMVKKTADASQPKSTEQVFQEMPTTDPAPPKTGPQRTEVRSKLPAVDENGKVVKVNEAEALEHQKKVAKSAEGDPVFRNDGDPVEIKPGSSQEFKGKRPQEVPKVVEFGEDPLTTPDMKKKAPLSQSSGMMSSEVKPKAEPKAPSQKVIIDDPALKAEAPAKPKPKSMIADEEINSFDSEITQDVDQDEFLRETARRQAGLGPTAKPVGPKTSVKMADNPSAPSASQRADVDQDELLRRRAGIQQEAAKDLMRGKPRQEVLAKQERAIDNLEKKPPLKDRPKLDLGDLEDQMDSPSETLHPERRRIAEQKLDTNPAIKKAELEKLDRKDAEIRAAQKETGNLPPEPVQEAKVVNLADARAKRAAPQPQAEVPQASAPGSVDADDLFEADVDTEVKRALADVNGKRGIPNSGRISQEEVDAQVQRALTENSPSANAPKKPLTENTNIHKVPKEAEVKAHYSKERAKVEADPKLTPEQRAAKLAKIKESEDFNLEVARNAEKARKAEQAIDTEAKALDEKLSKKLQDSFANKDKWGETPEELIKRKFDREKIDTDKKLSESLQKHLKENPNLSQKEIDALKAKKKELLDKKTADINRKQMEEIKQLEAKQKAMKAMPSTSADDAAEKAKAEARALDERLDKKAQENFKNGQRIEDPEDSIKAKFDVKKALEERKIRDKIAALKKEGSLSKETMKDLESKAEIEIAQKMDELNLEQAKEIKKHRENVFLNAQKEVEAQVKRNAAEAAQREADVVRRKAAVPTPIEPAKNPVRMIKADEIKDAFKQIDNEAKALDDELAKASEELVKNKHPMIRSKDSIKFKFDLEKNQAETRITKEFAAKKNNPNLSSADRQKLDAEMKNAIDEMKRDLNREQLRAVKQAEAEAAEQAKKANEAAKREPELVKSNVKDFPPPRKSANPVQMIRKADIDQAVREAEQRAPMRRAAGQNEPVGEIRPKMQPTPPKTPKPVPEELSNLSPQEKKIAERFDAQKQKAIAENEKRLEKTNPGISPKDKEKIISEIEDAADKAKVEAIKKHRNTQTGANATRQAYIDHQRKNYQAMRDKVEARFAGKTDTASRIERQAELDAINEKEAAFDRDMGL